MKRINTIARKLLNTIGMASIAQLKVNSYLKESGWFLSYRLGRAVDKNEKPIPWLTYPFLSFIENKLDKTFSVFEYGSGNSTIWFSERCKEIISVEHDKEWYGYISKHLPENASVKYVKLEYDGYYCRSISKFNQNYDIIIIDGRDRVNCAKIALDYLKENGIIIFDNSDVQDYEPGLNFLKEKSFKQIEFIGMSPITPHKTETSIFYGNKNCLGI